MNPIILATPVTSGTPAMAGRHVTAALSVTIIAMSLIAKAVILWIFSKGG